MNNKSPEARTVIPVTPHDRLLNFLKTKQAEAREKAEEYTPRPGRSGRRTGRSPKPKLPLLR